ncbi:MAG: tail fiber protein [Pseudomonadota bacterium]
MSLRMSRRAGLAAILSCAFLHGAAQAQAEPFLGQIMCAPYNFAPRGWAELNGQLLSIAQNTALFALIGTTYGGDGRTTFALPDMRGRNLVHYGQGPGLSARLLGEAGGTETVTLSAGNLPAHSHAVTPKGSTGDASQISPASGVAATKARTTLYAPGPGNIDMAPIQSAPTGASTPVGVMAPFLTVNCYIALEGIFPSRN